MPQHNGRREKEAVINCSPMVLTCVTAALEMHPVADPLNVPVATHDCCTIVVTEPWLLPTLWEREVDVVYEVIVVYSVAVADDTQDMVRSEVGQTIMPGQKPRRGEGKQVNGRSQKRGSRKKRKVAEAQLARKRTKW